MRVGQGRRGNWTLLCSVAFAICVAMPSVVRRWLERPRAPGPCGRSTPPELGIMKKCPTCQAGYGAGHDRCPWCAGGEPPACLSCGAPLTPDGEWCSRCDTPAGWYTPTPNLRDE